jgi:molybdopterin molybdotransferase
MPLISYAEAAEQIQRAIEARRVEQPATEIVSLLDAMGRVLAEAILADRDQPPFPRATRDGFAVRAAEANSHQPLRLTGLLRAGQANAASIPEGQAWEIMTGAVVPEGADAVFMVEHAIIDSADATVSLEAPRSIRPGENIVPQGAEARAGDQLIAAGVRINAAHIALAAQCGYPQLTVFRRPRVAILTTGDELVPIDATPEAHQIRDSNAPLLAALVATSGGDPWILPAAIDSLEALQKSISQASTADMLLISGGISAGRFDLVDQALERAGAKFQFRGVAMQPGKPVAFGELPAGDRGTIPIFALPGNPISSAVTFRLLAAPLLAALGGELKPAPRFAQAQLSENWSGNPGLTRFLPARCNFGWPATVCPVAWQGSGDLAAFARANCCLVIPADATAISAGTPVQILIS